MVFTVIDIETTGLSKTHDNMTEIAAAKVSNGKIVKEFHSMINPECKIPSFITKLTGIDNELVKDAPVIKDVIPGFLKFLGNDVFVAHNATFDFGFINHNAESYHNTTLLNDTLCTRKLANRLVPDLYSKKLGVLCEHFNIVNSNAHRAMSDVHATVNLLNNFLLILKEKNIHKIEEILKYEKSIRGSYIIK
jgi:DNA polymerase III epsilon subunit family exonuclease